MKKIIVSSFITLVASVAAVTAASLPDVPRPIDDLNGVVDNTPDSIDNARMARPVAGISRVGDNPVLFLVGNST
ncbi:MAG: rhamnogalacturonan acetylesterase, partial [Duncaniella sp.]|nr:rhamnogalacturonan acetylesterase [Duncaniella sp.]